MSDHIHCGNPSVLTFDLLALPFSNKAVVNRSNICAVVQCLAPLFSTQVLRLLVELSQSAIILQNTEHVSVVQNGVQHGDCATGIA